jgi:hypothetical protein
MRRPTQQLRSELATAARIASYLSRPPKNSRNTWDRPENAPLARGLRPFLDRGGVRFVSQAAPSSALAGSKVRSVRAVESGTTTRGQELQDIAILLPTSGHDAEHSFTEMGADLLTNSRQGCNKQHLFVPLLRQSIYNRVAGYEDVNDAE